MTPSRRSPRRSDGLVREHDDRLETALAALVARRDVAQRAADGRVEVGERAGGERDAERVAPGARERVAVVAADAHGSARNATRLGLEARLRLGAVVVGEPLPRRGAVAAHGQEDDDGRGEGTDEPADPATARRASGAGART